MRIKPKSLIIFVLCLLLLILLAAKGQGEPLPRGANVPRQEGCSEELSQRYRDSALTYLAEPAAAREGKRQAMSYQFWQLVTLGDMPEGLGPSEWILEGDRSSLDSIAKRVGEYDIVIIVPTADGDHMGATLEEDESLHGGLFRRRGGAVAAFFGDRAIVVEDGLRVTCRDTLWQGALIFIFRGEPIKERRTYEPSTKDTVFLQPTVIDRIVGRNFGVFLGPYGAWEHVDVPQAYFSTPTAGLMIRKEFGRWALSYHYSSGKRDRNDTCEVRIRTHGFDLGLPGVYLRKRDAQHFRPALIRPFVGIEYSAARFVDSRVDLYTHRSRGYTGNLGLSLGLPVSILWFEIGGSVGFGRTEVVWPDQIPNTVEDTWKFRVYSTVLF